MTESELLTIRIGCTVVWLPLVAMWWWPLFLYSWEWWTQ